MKINVGELIEILYQYDKNLPVTIDAYEVGITEKLFIRSVLLVDSDMGLDEEDLSSEESGMFGEWEEGRSGLGSLLISSSRV